MYNIKKIQERMQQHGFTSENDEQTKWGVGGGLSIEFITDDEEPGFALSHRGRNYFSRKFTVEEITSLIEVCEWFGILSERLVEIYDDCTENCEAVGHITLSEYIKLKKQATIAESYDQLKDRYETAKDTLEHLNDNYIVLENQNRQFNEGYLKMERDYNMYQRILSCILSQFEAREIDW